jgi:hypothetical protein
VVPAVLIRGVRREFPTCNGPTSAPVTSGTVANDTASASCFLPADTVKDQEKMRFSGLVQCQVTVSADVREIWAFSKLSVSPKLGVGKTTSFTEETDVCHLTPNLRSLQQAIPNGCPAKTLAPSQRLTIGLQALAGNRAVTGLADEFDVSRKCRFMAKWLLTSCPCLSRARCSTMSISVPAFAGSPTGWPMVGECRLEHARRHQILEKPGPREITQSPGLNGLPSSDENA